MEDLSLHILDIGENAINAGASLIEITLEEYIEQNILLLRIKDDGEGFGEEIQEKVLDPFYTTRETRRVGLGLPMLAQAVKEAEGDLRIESEEGQGTTITALFVYDHFDRKPLGDIAGTLMALIVMGADIDMVYEHRKNGKGFVLDTREIKKELQDVSIDSPGVLTYLKEIITDGLNELNKEGK